MAMSKASVTITQFEPVVYLRGQSASGEDSRGRRRHVDLDAPPSQLRGILTLHLPKPSKIKDISVSFSGTARTDWPEGIGLNRIELAEETPIIKQVVSLFNAKTEAGPHARRRCNSVGPGIDLDDDVDWDLAPPRARGEGDTAGNTPLPPTLARSITNAAARAGNAIIPTTLRTDLAAAKGKGRGQQGGSPVVSNRSTVTAAQPPLSPWEARPFFNDRRKPARKAAAAQTEMPNARSPLPGTPRAPSVPLEPPPVYEARSPSGTAAESAPTSEGSGSTLWCSSSSSAVLSPGTPDTAYSSPECTYAAREAASPFERSFATHTAAESVLEAGPAGRSILHQPGTPRQRDRVPAETAPPGVRFNRAAIAGESTRTQGQGSAPSSRRSSIDAATCDGAGGGGGGGGGVGAKEKGKKPGIKGLIGGLLNEKEKGREAGKEKGKEREAGRKEEDEAVTQDWKEFKKGTYTFPISIPLPSNLPPTLHADFGSNAYVLRAFVHRAGALTPNLSTEREVTLVHAPDEDGMEETDAIVVQRSWEDALSYMVVLYGKSFPVAGRIPLWIKLVPLEKVRIHRIVGTLEERTDYFAKGRRVARHEVPRRWTLLKLVNPDDPLEPLLPLSGTDPTILNTSPLTELARAAGATPLADSETVPALLDPAGPWEIFTDLVVPDCASTRINISTSHTRSNIAVHHVVRLAIRVERVGVEAVGGAMESADPLAPPAPPPPKKQLFDIIIEAPLALTHSRTAEAWTSLPNYWAVAAPAPAPATAGPTNLPADAPPLPAPPAPRRMSRLEASRHGDGASPGVARRIALPSPSVGAALSSGARSPSAAPAAPAPADIPLPAPPPGVVPGTTGIPGAGGLSTSPAAARELSMRWLTLSSSAGPQRRRRADSLPDAARAAVGDAEPDGAPPPPSYADTTAGQHTLALGEAPLAGRASVANSAQWGA